MIEIKDRSGNILLRDDSDALRNANLRDANLIGADLRDANLRNANLRNADLRDADLIGADLIGANLIGADLRGANLRNANFRNADLRDADLRDANLRCANLRNADLRNANLRNANLKLIIGNSREIKILMLEKWHVVVCGRFMAIGCKQYEIKEWFNFSDEEISKLDEEALTWWHKWKEFIFKAIELCDLDE